MLIESAIGDAYGAGFEFAPPGFVAACNTVDRYIVAPGRRLEVGHYTDDTQLSLAIAEAILSGEAWTPQNLANRFVSTFKRDPRPGYAAGFYGLLKEVKAGHELLKRLRPDSVRSGAAMRAAPIGVLPVVREVVEKSTVQAKITHNTPDGVRSAVAVSLSVHYMFYRLGPKHELFKFLGPYVPAHWFELWSGKVGTEGKSCVRAALTALMMCDSMRDLLRTAVAFTGDTDTVACIALAIGSCCAEMEQDLPEVLYDQLENGDYGHDYVKRLDAQLLARAA